MGRKSLPQRQSMRLASFMRGPVAVHPLWRVALLDGLFWLAVGHVRPFGMGSVWSRLGLSSESLALFLARSAFIEDHLSTSN